MIICLSLKTKAYDRSNSLILHFKGYPLTHLTALNAQTPTFMVPSLCLRSYSLPYA